MQGGRSHKFLMYSKCVFGFNYSEFENLCAANEFWAKTRPTLFGSRWLQRVVRRDKHTHFQERALCLYPEGRAQYGSHLLTSYKDPSYS
jgi:hypothetical protein